MWYAVKRASMDGETMLSQDVCESGHGSASPLDSRESGYSSASPLDSRESGLDPLALAYKIYPNTINPKQHLIHYTFSEYDAVEHTFYSTLYQLPYSPETFWTHLRFAGPSVHTLELLLITSNGDCKTLKTISQPNEWHTTEWPLPSFPISQAGLYLCLHYPKEPGHSPITISLIGFLHLFPITDRYLLCDYYPIFLFLRDDPCTYRSLVDMEDIEDKGIPLRPISHYH
jgi:hypothetical protein